ncbi:MULTISPECIES: glutamate--cysteine ligase [Colwellia]|uniref:Glutamate--cysteine ligase n=1 Tax=Colwellia marinimaniae TaxID=1513592 RepID=A0ABQ0MU80_9GAMM|nr:MULTISPECIES: glutamate--cysteine ligase [Colwellia]GAW95924.1 glutamate--cysteine ligase [Colwellia marinimaniae]
MTLSLTDYIGAFSQSENLAAVAGIGRGIEREALRILPEGKLSEHGHYHQLGSALTHGQITTDYSETLLEFITPVSHSPEQAIAQLQDIQKYTFDNIDGELLWPMSMPCFVTDAEKIPLAQYGSSNIGKMKTVYRQGLKNRYGSMMQVISGIHFNFSFSQDFWQVQHKLHQTEKIESAVGKPLPLDDFISDRYFSILRNYKRFCWLIPYLYGSSPAICSSFLQGKEHNLPFKKTPFGTLYLEYATSLRMSDLGYTSAEQSTLKICYNNLADYVAGVQQATKLKSKDFAGIGVKVNGQYQQLNDNVLQIENELYAPIRPKRVAKSGEKPSVALGERGVEYIEVRALDVNPLSDTGISLEQVYFLDIFLTFCAFVDNKEFDCSAQKIHESNMNDVVLRGRDPELLLSDTNNQGDVVLKSVTTWGNEIFEQLKLVAELLDKAYQTSNYSAAIVREQAKINDANLTPSAQILTAIQEQSLSQYALDKASKYRQQAKERDYQFYSQTFFDESVPVSHQAQADIEAADVLNFDDFLADYFA